MSNMLDYLVREKLSSEDLSALKSSKIFMRESSPDNEEENTCHRIDELYPPVEIFRSLRLPVIKWDGKSEWSDTSPQGDLSAICIPFV